MPLSLATVRANLVFSIGCSRGRLIPRHCLSLLGLLSEVRIKTNSCLVAERLARHERSWRIAIVFGIGRSLWGYVTQEAHLPHLRYFGVRYRENELSWWEKGLAMVHIVGFPFIQSAVTFLGSSFWRVS